MLDNCQEENYTVEVTSKDRTNIKRLYYFHNYLPAVIAKLFGLSRERISQILQEEGGETIINNAMECLLCGNEDCSKFYIDGNDENNKPQNVIMLCEYDCRRLKHMQMRRNRKEILTPPSL